MSSEESVEHSAETLRLLDKFEEAAMLVVFNIPRPSKQMKIPDGYFPTESVDYIIKELGFHFLAVNEDQKIKDGLVNRAGRDTSKGKEFMSIKDLIRFLEPYIIEYTDK